MRNVLGVVVTLSIAMGCDVDPSNESTNLGEAQLLEQGDEADAIIAEIQVAEGSFIRFIDESVSIPDGGVGVLTIGAPDVARVLEDLELTPLELFVALVPSEDIPEILKSHHKSIEESGSRIALDPHQLPLGEGFWVPSFDLGAKPKKTLTQTSGSHQCANAGTAGDWCDWQSDLWVGDTADSVVCDHDDVGNRFGDGGLATERWLGVCNNATTNIAWKVQNELSAGVWSDVSGTSLNVGQDVSVVYTSSGFAIMRYRSSITATSSQHYQWGAAHD